MSPYLSQVGADTARYSGAEPLQFTQGGIAENVIEMPDEKRRKGILDDPSPYAVPTLVF